MSKPTLYGKLRFCPKCGADKIERDLTLKERRPDIVEYSCQVCFFGFRISKSARAANAELLHKENRSIRIGNFQENVTPEARAAFEAQYPEPWRFKLWRAWRRLCRVPQDTNTYAANKKRVSGSLRQH